MVKEIIKDKAGNPVSVLLSYNEWVQTEELVAQLRNKTNAPANPLDWYALTETANSILNDLLAYIGRERGIERRKEQPDLKRMGALWELFKEIHALNKNADNFKDAGRMQEIIEIYSPQLKRVNNGEQLV